MARKTPLPNEPANKNRGNDIRRDKDTVKEVSVGLLDIDGAILYYFNEILKPTIIDNGEVVKVPVIYSHPERWKAIQKDGYLRDKSNQIILPVITVKRTSVEKDTSISMYPMDANKPHLFYQFQRKTTKEDRFKDLQNQQQIKNAREFYLTAIPKYVIINYDCIIWTTYMEQMNSLVEKINWSKRSYWGDPDKFKFKSNISSFEDVTEYEEERIVKTTFSISLKGYLIPESFNDYITTEKKISKQLLLDYNVE